MDSIIECDTSAHKDAWSSTNKNQRGIALTNCLVKNKKGKKLTISQWMTLFAIGSVHFSGAVCVSLQAPFYPQEAESKGATATEYGLVFGSFKLMSFISSPVIGRYMAAIGVKTTLNMGMVLAGISVICFGLLDLIESHFGFIFLSFILRMTESLGATAALVSAFSITAAAFPDSVATTFAALEGFYGLGYIVGPTLGGLLFSWGGYKLPFVVMGTLMLLFTFLVYLILPPLGKTTEDSPLISVRDVLKVPGVLLDSIAVVATSTSMGFLVATLEPHIRIFELSPIANGFMFTILGGTYAIAAPFVGRICDKWVYPKRVMSVGALLVVAAYIIIGPAPFLGIPMTLTLCIIGLVVHGFGLAALMVPTFIDSICSAVGAGFPDDLSTYGVISGLWSSSFALGAFVGPSVSGYLYDLIGFQYGTFFVIAIHVSLVTVFTVVICPLLGTKLNRRMFTDPNKYLKALARQMRNFIGVTIFIAMEKKMVISPKRVRLLSHVPDSSSEEDIIRPKYIPSWEEKVASSGKSTLYGTMADVHTSS